MIRVVAAAIVVDARVLAARRADVGGWEFPGGKVEADEPERTALVRECREELSVLVRSRCRLAVVADERIELVLWQADVVGEAPSTSSDHDELRWLAVDQLDEVDWLPLDRGLLPAVRQLLIGETR